MSNAQRTKIEQTESVVIWQWYGKYFAVDHNAPGQPVVSQGYDLREIRADVRFYLYSDNPSFN